MAMDFPSSPSDGQTYTPSGGATYTYNAAGNKWHVTGTGLSGMAGASQAEQEAATSTSVAVTPGNQHWHPGSAKGWAYLGFDGSLGAGYKVSSIVDNGTGDASVNWAVTFTSAGAHTCNVSVQHTSVFLVGQVFEQTASANRVASHNMSANTDPAAYSVAVFGDLP